MDIAIRIEGRHDLTGQIFRQLRTAIVDDGSPPAARLRRRATSRNSSREDDARRVRASRRAERLPEYAAR